MHTAALLLSVHQLHTRLARAIGALHATGCPAFNEHSRTPSTPSCCWQISHLAHFSRRPNTLFAAPTHLHTLLSPPIKSNTLLSIILFFHLSYCILLSHSLASVYCISKTGKLRELAARTASSYVNRKHKAQGYRTFFTRFSGQQQIYRFTDF